MTTNFIRLYVINIWGHHDDTYNNNWKFHLYLGKYLKIVGLILPKSNYVIFSI